MLNVRRDHRRRDMMAMGWDTVSGVENRGTMRARRIGEKGRGLVKN